MVGVVRKELTTEQKAERYDKALEKAKKWYDANTNESYRGIFEEIFSELRDDKDERIWKEFCEDIWTYMPNEKAHKYITWLEKQSEQKAAELSKDESEQKQDVSIQINPSEYINDMGGNGCYLKNAKQQLAWSEEDKNAIRVLKDIVKHSNEINENIYTMPLKEKLYDWLKSLRDRVGNFDDSYKVGFSAAKCNQ